MQIQMYLFDFVVFCNYGMHNIFKAEMGVSMIILGMLLATFLPAV